MTAGASSPLGKMCGLAALGVVCLTGAMSTAWPTQAQELKSTTLQTRLDSLRAEYETGQKQMEALDDRRANLANTLLRISGAIQVLEELLAEPPAQ